MKRVSLYDIEDVEAFSIMCVKRSGCNAPPVYWDDLVAEGIVLLYGMAKNYKPKMNGYAKEGCFSGYAVMWLPKQIKQSWHKSQEHHLHVTDPVTSKRGWTRRYSPVSYEQYVLHMDSEKHLAQEVYVRQVKDFVQVPLHKDDE